VADFEPFAFDPTAFMSGQIGSKVWLCDTLEPIAKERFNRPVTIWVLGGWYGMTSFLLQTRGRLPIERVTSFDIDPLVERGARVLNENFSFAGTFAARTQDVCALDYTQAPDIVINTSTEHMEDESWYARIPAGTLCVFQSNDMPHDDHVHHCHSREDLEGRFPLQTLYSGDKFFDYIVWSFTRYMHIGIK
jgi:hypothetical protein